MLNGHTKGEVSVRQQRPTLRLGRLDPSSGATPAKETKPRPGAPVSAATGPSKPKAAPGKAKAANSVREWREFRRGASPVPHSINAWDVGWLIEGGDDNKGKTILGFRNGGEKPIVIDHPVAEVAVWLQQHRATRVFVLANTGRILVLTPDVVCSCKADDADSRWTSALLRGKGVKRIPIDVTYADFKAWLDAGLAS